MTMKEIADRLRKEFPGIHTSITLEAGCFMDGDACTQVRAYTNHPDPHSHDVANVDAAFAWLEEQYRPAPDTSGDHVIAGEDMGEPQCPAES